ncbi:MAG: DUF4493 domain-containing protein [Bacteroidaceae bacterium]|nr:DUF4493 domain-containing protein [Bacteroidaceae bacterium]
MKFLNKFKIGVLCTVLFTSCVTETIDIDRSAQGEGTAVFNVRVKTPEKTETRAVSQVTDFPLDVYDAEGKQVLSYNAISEIPEQVVMAVGNYVVQSHTPGIIQKRMSDPYYSGTETMEILKGVTSNVDIVCKMQNSLITVNYSQEFRDVFQSWEITISDGSETVLSFTNTEFTNAVYWYFGEEGAKELTVNFRGMTADGSRITSRSLLTKDQADESYDDDRENFGGGDALTLNFSPTESTDGKINAISINANVTFTETNEEVTVIVVDKPGFEEGGNQGGDEPGNDDSKILLNLPQNMVLAPGTDPSLGNTYIKCENGIKSIVVKMSSTSEDMLSSLADLEDGYHVDFVNGAEVVGNTQMVNLFTELGQTLTVPAQGDKEYTFPIGNFFSLLQVLPGAHTFDLVITDMKGGKKEGSLTLTVN